MVIVNFSDKCPGPGREIYSRTYSMVREVFLLSTLSKWEFLIEVQTLPCHFILAMLGWLNLSFGKTVTRLGIRYSK